MTTKLTVLISGGTSGVGLAIAKSFAKLGANLTLIGRQPQKAQAAANRLAALPGHPTVSTLLGDLSDPTTNQQLAQAFLATHDHLDVLVNSAGTLPTTGAENISVNLQSHYWLTHHLTPALAQAAVPRVFVITGAPLAIKMAPINECQRTTLERGAWLLTHKTLLVSLLAHQLQPQQINVNAIFPGEVRSELMPWTAQLANTTVDVVAQLVQHPGQRHPTGTFFDAQGHAIPLSPQKYNAKRAKHVLAPYLNC